MIERQGLIRFHDKDAIVIGKDIQLGDKAPEFQATNQEWEQIRVLESTRGKVRIIAAVPSLDTEVCDRETRRFNEEASQLSENIAIIVMSTDLPFTQKRWCGSAGIENILVLSDHLNAEFGEKYGCLLKEARILRRAVFVVDSQDKVIYVEYMPELGVEPDYKAVLRASKSALS
jgi:thiol peroxidase